MSWLVHECWYCGHKSHEVDFLACSAEYHALRGKSPYQCKWRNREACEKRREARHG